VRGAGGCGPGLCGWADVPTNYKQIRLWFTQESNVAAFMGLDGLGLDVRDNVNGKTVAAAVTP
jgi:hypothetical protein